MQDAPTAVAVAAAAEEPATAKHAAKPAAPGAAAKRRSAQPTESCGLVSNDALQEEEVEAPGSTK